MLISGLGFKEIWYFKTLNVTIIIDLQKSKVFIWLKATVLQLKTYFVTFTLPVLVVIPFLLIDSSRAISGTKRCAKSITSQRSWRVCSIFWKKKKFHHFHINSSPKVIHPKYYPKHLAYVLAHKMGFGVHWINKLSITIIYLSSFLAKNIF